MPLVEIPILARKDIVAPVEEQFHIYPVLLIPSERPGEAIVIGRRKAMAIIKHYQAIAAFMERHPE
jgi:hypothetical protein